MPLIHDLELARLRAPETAHADAAVAAVADGEGADVGGLQAQARRRAVGVLGVPEDGARGGEGVGDVERGQAAAAAGCKGRRARWGGQGGCL